MKELKPASIKERTYRKGFYDRGICYECKKNPRIDNRVMCIECRDKWKHYQKEWRQSAKLKIFEVYGGAFCACCGESGFLFLCLDHMNNDGASHRRQLTGSSRDASKLYQWIIRNNYPTGFQVLCHNCNFGKHLNGGTCPHQTKKVMNARN